MTSPQRQPASRLEELLRAGRFVVTAEITPPVSCDADDLLRKALPLAGLADAVNVTDGASARAHLCAPIAAALLARAGIEPILQFTCRDRNRIALQADLMGAAACGVRNLLCLTGDDPAAGDQPQTKAVFDVDSTTLTAMARDLRDKGELASGRKVAGRAPFFLGAADVPIDPPAGWRPDKLAAKIAAGAEFAQTQFCMDAEVVRQLRRAPGRARGNAGHLPADRNCAAALGAIGALDAAAPLRHHHCGGLHRAAGTRRRSGRRG
jgi:methylenetetrahydrofolate reductase (NADPH)